MNRTRPVRIVRYYPRALAGDGGMTNAVRCWCEGTAAAGADVSVVYSGGQTRSPGQSPSQGRWIPVRHVGGRPGTRPLGLAPGPRRAGRALVDPASAAPNAWGGPV